MDAMTGPNSSSSSSSMVFHRDQTQIRKRLLFSLGIEGGPADDEVASSPPSITRGTVRSTPHLPCNRLNADHDDDESSCSSSSSSRRTVRFTAEVPSVREIPSHRDYPDEDRKLIWMGRKEIDRNARRNRMEYLADGCDYRKATEENRMIRWPATGELIHPATYWIRYEEEQQQQLLSIQQEEFGFRSSVSGSSRSNSMGGLRKSPTITSLTGMAA